MERLSPLTVTEMLHSGMSVADIAVMFGVELEAVVALRDSPLFTAWARMADDGKRKRGAKSG